MRHQAAPFTYKLIDLRHNKSVLNWTDTHPLHCKINFTKKCLSGKNALAYFANDGSKGFVASTPVRRLPGLRPHRPEPWAEQAGTEVNLRLRCVDICELSSPKRRKRRLQRRQRR
jgi:hypothetical protein